MLLVAESCRMDVIDTICYERLALADILTERQRHFLDVLRNIEAVNHDDLHIILQQYCSLRSKVIAAMEELNILEEDYEISELAAFQFTKNSSFQSHNSIRSLDHCSRKLVTRSSTS